MKYRTSWLATYAWNCASVGESSPPVNPPIAMIEAPVLSSRLLAVNDPTLAAAQRLSRPSTSSASAGLSAWAPPGPWSAGPRRIRASCCGARSRHRSVVCGRDGFDGVGRRRARREKDCPGGQYRGGLPRPVRADGKHRRRHHRSGQHDPTQRRQPLRRAVQQDERPDAGRRGHGRQHETRGSRSLIRHSSRTEMPTSAAIAGARATV